MRTEKISRTPNRLLHNVEDCQESRRLLTVQKAAAQLGISVWTLRQMAYGGRVSSHKIGTRLLIAEDEIERVINESERPRFTA
jgi:excisionase family DNA binding protein